MDFYHTDPTTYSDSSMENHPTFGRIEKEEPAPAKVYQLKVTEEGYKGNYKVMEVGTDEDWDGDSDGWHYCGALRAFGSTIQEALDNFLDAINETVNEDIKYRWS